MQIGARMLGRAEADAGGGARRRAWYASAAPGADGTLLAVVPIPGTGTSLAIVGYPVTAPGSGPGAALFPASAFVTTPSRSRRDGLRRPVVVAWFVTARCSQA